MDGEGMDVWAGTASERTIRGVICTVDSVKRDSEIKLLFACTQAEIRGIWNFTNARDEMKGF